MIWPLFRKMAANQKPLNQIGIFWYQFTPRKLLYLVILVNLVKFGPHWLSFFGGPPCIMLSLKRIVTIQDSGDKKSNWSCETSFYRQASSTYSAEGEVQADAIYEAIDELGDALYLTPFPAELSSQMTSQSKYYILISVSWHWEISCVYLLYISSNLRR